MATNGSFPNLVIAGAPKCGTSSLYFWLAPHPQVCASSVKETFYLADNESRFNETLNYHKDGLNGYVKHFKACDTAKITFEATAPYIYYNTPLKVLPQLNPVPKIGFILREPARRLYSKYTFSKYKVKNFSRSFEEYISLEGSKFSGHHVNEGDYASYLKKWVAVFGSKSIFVLTLEELMADQQAGMKRFAHWLGIDPAFYDTFDFTKRNETFGVRSTGFHRLGLKLQPLVPYKLQEVLIPIYQKINGTAIPKISEQEQRLVGELKQFYKPANQNLKSLFPNLDLSAW
jgi:hypothetical protein